MRIHLSRPVIELLRKSGEEGSPLRRAVEDLWRDPRPADALNTPERPDRYEIFRAGYWIICEIDKSGGETVVRVTAIEAN